MRAPAVRTIWSQSSCGWDWGEVMISTMSPLRSSWRSVTSSPFTRAPTVRWPTSVWMRNAKSSAVAPLGRRLSSRRGV